MTDTLGYHRHLEAVQVADLEYVRRKDAQYAASWKRRGGVGAFFTIVRPWDRLENLLERLPERLAARGEAAQYDVFRAIREEGLSGPDGSVIACVRDVRRYLLLLEAEMREQLASKSAERSAVEYDIQRDLPTSPTETFSPGTPEDGGHHARVDPDWPWVVSYASPCHDERARGVNVLSHRIPKWTYDNLASGTVRELYSKVWLYPALGDAPISHGDSPPAGSSDDPVAYWLRVGEAPEHLRAYWRELPPEQNLKEAEDLREYLELYRWDATRLRYLLRRREWSAQ